MPFNDDIETHDFMFQAMTEAGITMERQKRLLGVVLCGIRDYMPDLVEIMLDATEAETDQQFRRIAVLVRQIDAVFCSKEGVT